MKKVIVPISSILFYRKSIYNTMDHYLAKRYSRSISEPVELYYREDIDKYLVQDGMHRILEAMLNGKTKIEAIIVGSGDNFQTDLATPSKDMALKHTNTKFRGLEDLADEEVLEDLLEEVTKYRSLKISENPRKPDNRTYKNFQFWPTKKLQEVINDPYHRGVDGHDYGPYIEEIQEALWERQSKQNFDKEIKLRYGKNPKGNSMSARSFSIAKTKKFGNVKISNTPDQIIVTLHETDVVVYNKNDGSIRLNSGGWHTLTTKTAINNALSQLEDITGHNFPRISQVKGKWYLGEMEFRDGMKYAKRKLNPMKYKRNPADPRAIKISNEIMKEFNSQKHYSWDVFDYHSNRNTYSVSDLIKALKSGEDIGGDDLMMYVADSASEMASYWIKENVEEEFEELEELDGSIAAETHDEIRFKFEELANYNFPLPSPLFIIDPSTLIGYQEAKKKNQQFYRSDSWLSGPHYTDEKEAEKELKIVKKLGKKFGFTDKECEEVYMNASYGGTLGIAIITDEVKELYEAVLRQIPVELSGDCVLFIHHGGNGSGDYMIKGQHTIRIADSRELVSMIDSDENTRYSLGDVFGTSDWKY